VTASCAAPSIIRNACCYTVAAPYYTACCDNDRHILLCTLRAPSGTRWLCAHTTRVSRCTAAFCLHCCAGASRTARTLHPRVAPAATVGRSSIASASSVRTTFLFSGRVAFHRVRHLRGTRAAYLSSAALRLFVSIGARAAHTPGALRTATSVMARGIARSVVELEVAS